VLCLTSPRSRWRWNAVPHFPTGGKRNDLELATQGRASVYQLHYVVTLKIASPTRETKPSAYSERCRSPFRGDGDRDSELMPITIPR